MMMLLIYQCFTVEGIDVDKDVNFSYCKIFHKEYMTYLYDESYSAIYFIYRTICYRYFIWFRKVVEILCQIVNPIVLENCNIDSEEFSGLHLARVERIAMLKYWCNDIRDFYKSNLDFLAQLKWKYHTHIVQSTKKNFYWRNFDRLFQIRWSMKLRMNFDIESHQIGAIAHSNQYIERLECFL